MVDRRPLLLDDSGPLVDALVAIARGHRDCGRPLAGEYARQLARVALIDLGLTWAEIPVVGA